MDSFDKEIDDLEKQIQQNSDPQKIEAVNVEKPEEASSSIETPIVNGNFKPFSEDFKKEFTSDEKITQEDLPSCVERKTLGELGNRVPIGFFSPTDINKRLREFAFTKWTFKEERRIAAIKQQMTKQRRGPLFITKMLIEMSEHIFNVPVKQIQIEQQQLGFVGQFFWCDVLYMYFFFRNFAIGKEVNMEIECPVCSKRFTYAANIESLTVRTLKEGASINDLSQKVELDQGFFYKDKHYKNLYIAPTRWFSMMNSTDGTLQDESVMKEMFIKSSVTGINEPYEQGFFWDNTILEQLYKYDFEKLYQEIIKNNLGPELFISVRCPEPSCNEVLYRVLDWSYDSFFTILSRSRIST